MTFRDSHFRCALTIFDSLGTSEESRTTKTTHEITKLLCHFKEKVKRENYDEEHSFIHERMSMRIYLRIACRDAIIIYREEWGNEMNTRCWWCSRREIIFLLLLFRFVCVVRSSHIFSIFITFCYYIFTLQHICSPLCIRVSGVDHC